LDLFGCKQLEMKALVPKKIRGEIGTGLICCVSEESAQKLGPPAAFRETQMPRFCSNDLFRAMRKRDLCQLMGKLESGKWVLNSNQSAVLHPGILRKQLFETG
jgi:tRNA-binding EMAP/Myf-like protein